MSGKIFPYVAEFDGAVAVWRIENGTSNWKVQTEFRLWNWSDLLRDDFQPWNLSRAWIALKALYRFVVSGAGWHYFRVNRRFAMFFFYPLLSALFFAFIALLIARILVAFDIPYPLSIGFAVAAILFAGFIKWVDPLVFQRVVRLWIFTHELIYLERSNLAERLGIFSRDLIEILKRDEFDEIIIAGHGFGAALLPVVVDRAFWDHPEFSESGKKIHILSTGSMLLTVGLHPEGSWVVGPVARIARDQMVFWVEYQAKDDLIAFPGCNPVKILTDGSGNLIRQTIDINKMTLIDPNRKLASRIYQGHRQSILANSKRYFYDYFMICCGPILATNAGKKPQPYGRGV